MEQWLNWIAASTAVIAALTGIIGIYMSHRQRREAKLYAEKQLKAQNIAIALAETALNEARKTPGQRRADDLARRGGFSSHAAHLAREDERVHFPDQIKEGAEK